MLCRQGKLAAKWKACFIFEFNRNQTCQMCRTVRVLVSHPPVESIYGESRREKQRGHKMSTTLFLLSMDDGIINNSGIVPTSEWCRSLCILIFFFEIASSIPDETAKEASLHGNMAYPNRLCAQRESSLSMHASSQKNAWHKR